MADKHLSKQLKLLLLKRLGAAIVAVTLAASGTARVAAEEGAEGGKRLTEEIIVTATYRDTDLMDTSISISALTGQELEEQGIFNLSNLYTAVPGMSYGSTSGGAYNTVTVRGLSPPGRGSSVVAIYVDDVPVTSGSQNQIAGSLFDMERIEVLKGPQGTLYGEGAMGGAIRYITRKPNPEEFEFGLMSSLSNDSESDDLSYRLGAMVNMPLLENKLALRLSAYSRDRAGFIDVTGNREADDVNTQEEKSLRARLTWFATENLEITLGANLVENESEGPGLADFPHVTNTRNAIGFPNEGLDDQDIYNLTISYDLPWANFQSITSHYEREFRYQEEFSNDDLALFDTFISFLAFFDPTFTDPPPYLAAAGSAGLGAIDSERFIQEFRLVSNGDGPWAWSTGIYYKDIDGSAGEDGLPTFLTVPARPELIPRVPQFNALFGAGQQIDNTDEEKAVYGNVSYQLNDHWNVGLGLRFSNIERSTEGIDLDIDEDFVTTRLTIDYQPYDGMLAYFTASQGFRPGVANDRLLVSINSLQMLAGVPQAAQDAAFLASKLVSDGDEVTNYELGLKSIFLDGRVRLIASLYYIDWEDTIVTQSAVTLLPAPVTFSENGGGARSQGVELSLDVDLMEGLRLTVSGDYNDEAEIEGNSAPVLPGSPAVLDGNRLANAPEYSFNVALDYEFNLGAFRGGVRGDWAGVGHSFHRVTNEFKTPSYRRFNLRLNLRDQEEKWRATLFANNLFAEDIIYEINEQGLSLGPSRVIGVEFNYNL